MPILIKDHSWRQTEDLVIVRVPLRNIPHTKVDLFHSDIYIKVHFPPFLFECCLYGYIDEDKSKCTLVQGEAVFELAKIEKKEWSTLEKNISKSEMTQIKKEAIEHVQKREKELREKKNVMQRQRKTDCIGQQIALNDKDRGAIKEKKEEEKRKAYEEILEWKEKDTDQNFLPNPLEKATAMLKSITEAKRLQNEKVEAKKSNDAYNSEIKDVRTNGCGKSNCEKKGKSFNELLIWKPEEVEERKVLKRGDNKAQNSSKLPVNKTVSPEVPQPRVFGSISVDFTYRAFPTPCRESKLNEETEWLKRQKEARRKTGFVVEDLRPEENDPVWLMEKGKSFHNAGNYLGAISAFSHALRTWDKIPELYVARCNSQLAIGNFRRVLEDTCEALELLKPHVDSNAEMRFQAHSNRGKALLELGKPDSAIADFVEALEIHPYREDICNLMDRAESDLERRKLRIEEEKSKTPEPPKTGVQSEFIDSKVLAC